MNKEILAQLERLTYLETSGGITEAEFEQYKAALLRGLPSQPVAPPEPQKTAVPSKPSNTKAGLGCLMFLFILWIIYLVIPSGSSRTTTTTTKTTDVGGESSLSSDLQMAPYKARRAVKNQLKDPDSFDEIDSKAAYYGKEGIYIICVVRYRAKNSFGGMSIETARVDLDKSLAPIAVTLKPLAKP